MYLCKNVSLVLLLKDEIKYSALEIKWTTTSGIQTISQLLTHFILNESIQLTV